MMKKSLLSLVAIPILLFGCSEEVEVDTLDSGKNIPVAVEVEVLNELTFEPGQEVELAARVTQGDEVVNDADEVKFEVWESGKRTEGVMLDGVFSEDGIYSIKYTFPHEGMYYMFAHTTARGMHVMPRVELIVGEPDMSKVLEDTNDHSMMHNDMGHSEHSEKPTH